MDIAVPVVVALWLAMLILGPPREDPPWTLVGLVVGLVSGGALYWRRVYPERVMLITLAGGLVILLIFPDAVFPYAGLIAIGSLAAARPPRVSLFGLAALLALTTLNYLTQPSEDATFAMLLPVVAWALGEAARNRRIAIEQASRRAVGDEQARIARELHDVIAHSVSVIVVQAAAADDVFDERPDQARAALRSIESAGREALAELRRLLGAVRPDAEGEPARPQPGLDRLGELAAPLRAAGLEVALTRDDAGDDPARGRRPLRLPDRAGGAHEHAAPRRRDARRGHRPLRAGHARARRPRRRPRRHAAVHRRRRPRHRRDARARDDARRHARGRAAARGRLPRPRPPAAGGIVTIGVVLADDQALVRGGFRMILDNKADLEVLGEAADGREAVALVERLKPDVVLMDVRMPDVDGLEATRRIVGAGSPARIIVLTTYDVDEYVFAALRAGASGFMLKDVRPAELVDAIRVVAGGDALLAPSVTRRLLDRFADSLPGPDAAPPADLGELTEREVEVLRLVALALSNAEIAERLVLTEATVKTHVSSVLRKLGLRDRVQAVVLAYDVGLVRPRSA